MIAVRTDLDVMAVLADWRKDLEYETTGEGVKVRLKRRIGTDSFNKLYMKVKQMHGYYVRAGRNSHFYIPLPK